MLETKTKIHKEKIITFLLFFSFFYCSEETVQIHVTPKFIYYNTLNILPVKDKPTRKANYKSLVEIDEVADLVSTVVSNKFNYDFSKSEVHVNDGSFVPKLMRMLGQTLFEEEVTLALFHQGARKKV